MIRIFYCTRTVEQLEDLKTAYKDEQPDLELMLLAVAFVLLPFSAGPLLAFSLLKVSQLLPAELLPPEIALFPLTPKYLHLALED